VPLLDKGSLTRLEKSYRRSGGRLAFLTFSPADPAAYGRVLRGDDGRPVAIREWRDCSPAERKVGEVNAGIYLAEIGFLRRSVKKLTSENQQRELYLTDLVEMAAAAGEVGTVTVRPEIVGGVNDRVDLAAIEALLAAEINTRLMRGGVTIHRPDSVLVDLGVTVGADTELGPGVRLAGETKVGRGCRIEAGVQVVDSVIEAGAVVKAYSVLEGARVGRGAEIGPLGRLRPGAEIGEGARVGNFVEVKKTKLGRGSKASHLSYLGDGIVGEGVNIGAGTIFCNYDGFQKHRTVLEDDVFIGSDSQLVAPVTVGRGAYVASGSTVTRDVPADALAVSRAKQQNKKGVAAALRRRLEALKRRAMEASAVQRKGERE
jgi:bifunctional UDP-N-acetylglucosamine pyrophosphorylase/glucosamine-1-phosphate N-acetyltransferase